MTAAIIHTYKYRRYGIPSDSIPKFKMAWTIVHDDGFEEKIAYTNRP